MTALVMSLSMFYITAEWCLQSFLSTEDYDEAMTGLQMTRNYRHRTFFLRWTCRKILSITLDQLERLAKAIGIIRKRQTTLLWTKTHKHDWTPTRASSEVHMQHHHTASPTIELTDYSTPSLGQTIAEAYETPALAPNSQFPLPSSYRPRNESDASVSGPSFTYRTSEDSSQALIRPPSEAYHHPERERRASGEGHVSFDDTSFLTTPEQDPRAGGRVGGGSTVHIRHGYQRANSNPDLPSADIVDASQRGLGIHLDDRDLERGSP
jgi:hypothetical protein